MILLDAGTTWAKIIGQKSSGMHDKLGAYFIKEENERSYYIMPSQELKNTGIKFDSAAGHMSKNFLKPDGILENEFIALIKGFRKKIQDENAVIIDMGSRDIKCALFKNGVFKDLDWNSSCSSSTGATIEMLLKFYSIKEEDLKYTPEKYSIACGIFGLEKIMDDTASGCPPETAVSKFIHGIAYNAWCFAKKPEKLYLSGGLCRNECFKTALGAYCRVIPMGRFLIAEGLLPD